MKDGGCFGGVWVPPDVGLISCPQVPCWQEALGGSPRASPILSVPFLAANWGLVTVNLLGSAWEGGDACGKQVSWNAFPLLTRCGVKKQTGERKGNPPIRCELGSEADEPRETGLLISPPGYRGCPRLTSHAGTAQREPGKAGSAGTQGSVCAHAGTCRDTQGPASVARRLLRGLHASVLCRCLLRGLRGAQQHSERCSSFMPCLFVFFLGVDPSALNNLEVSGRSSGGFQYVFSVSATWLRTGLVFRVLQ